MEIEVAFPSGRVQIVSAGLAGEIRSTQPADARQGGPRTMRPKANVGLCAFLGEPTGRLLKKSCRGKEKRLIECHCYHERRRVWLPRAGRFASGKCTPAGTCNDAAAGIMPCPRCPLFQPQRLLNESQTQQKPSYIDVH